MMRQGDTRALAVIIMLSLTGSIPAQEPKVRSGLAPALPYIAKNKCPFEGCVYREWTALKDTPTYTTWRGTRKRAGTVRKGEKVTAVGVLWSLSAPASSMWIETFPNRD